MHHNNSITYKSCFTQLPYQIFLKNICKNYSTVTSIVSIISYLCIAQRLAQLDKELKTREGKKTKKDGPSSSLPACKKSRRK